MAWRKIEDAKLTAIADAIRAKAEKSDTMTIGEMPTEIAGISTGVTIQRKEGKFTTNSSGKATVNCGFKPDTVVILSTEGASDVSAAADFYATGNTKTEVGITDKTCLSYVIVTQSSTGFNAFCHYDDYTGEYLVDEGSNYNYIAVKYTA